MSIPSRTPPRAGNGNSSVSDSAPDSAREPGLRVSISSAERLAELGVPVFTARLTPEGQPDKSDRRWDSWQKTTPGEQSLQAVHAWKPGLALCAVTGVTYDVLDYDPKNGGKASLDVMDKALGDNGPELYWEVATPNGGRHFYIAPLDIGSHNGFLPGLDLKGGRSDGTSRGFVFIPPTVRPRLAGGRGSYRPVRPLAAVNGEPFPDDFRSWVEMCLERRAAGSGNNSSGRTGSDALRRACLVAGPGEQREALLRYTHELERRGYEREDMIFLLRTLCGEMKSFDARSPWYPARGGNPDKWIIGLLHAPGEVVGDGTPAEAEVLAAAEPLRPEISLVKPFSSMEMEFVEWVWEGYLARAEITVLDGEKGQGKSLITLDVAARLSRGWAMPGSAEASVLAGPVNVIVFTEESNAQKEILPRLLAAGADMDRIFCPQIRHDRRGKAAGLELPDSAAMFGRMIRAAKASVAIWDPITDFIAEDIQTHNDASVRRALRPLGPVLRTENCAGWMLRHMNKDSGARAKFRGAGTTAFQNRARVHLVTGEIPSNIEGMFGLAVVDSNLRRKEEGVLAYDIVDSDLAADREGRSYVAKLDWIGMVELDVDALTGGRARRRGPTESPMQDLLEEVLSDMFSRRATWRVEEAKRELKAAGCTLNDRTVAKVRQALGIRTRRVRRRGAVGVESWEWTVEPVKEGQNGEPGRGDRLI